ncbi:Hypothetical predicted protein [Pelobates cultripes]|uniref:Uncharacterized protein n=1 Tax=Pelobates cultripes TaxID=61616 RepID=A0AAD1RX88_PELCU|nr:Hypothetical predicted protein [Pelobates cultripes]
MYGCEPVELSSPTSSEPVTVQYVPEFLFGDMFMQTSQANALSARKNRNIDGPPTVSIFDDPLYIPTPLKKRKSFLSTVHLDPFSRQVSIINEPPYDPTPLKKRKSFISTAHLGPFSKQVSIIDEPPYDPTPLKKRKSFISTAHLGPFSKQVSIIDEPPYDPTPLKKRKSFISTAHLGPFSKQVSIIDEPPYDPTPLKKRKSFLSTAHLGPFSNHGKRQALDDTWGKVSDSTGVVNIKGKYSLPKTRMRKLAAGYSASSSPSSVTQQPQICKEGILSRVITYLFQL